MKSISTLFRQLSLIVVLISAFSLSAWGEETLETTFSSDDVVTNSSYKLYDNSNWELSFGGNNKSGGTNSGNASKCKLTDTYGTSVNKNNLAFAITSKNKLENINKITFVYTGGSNNSEGLIYLAYSTDATNYTAVPLIGSTSQGANVGSTNTTYTLEFNPISSAYYKIIIGSNKTSGAFRFDDITANFYSVSSSGGETPEPTQLTPPTILNATNITASSFTANWTAVDNATSYIVTANSTSQIVTTTSCTFSGLAPETEYEYTVVAKGDGIDYIDSDAASATVTTAEQPTYNVTLYNGDTQYGEVLNGSMVDLPTTGPTPSETCQNAGWEFAGWSITKITENTNSATLLTGTYTPKEDITLYAVYKLEGTSSTGSAEAWALTDIADISATDEVVITMTYTDGTIYALSSSNETNSAPTATILTASNNNLSEAPADDLVWNISKNDDSYTIYPNGKTTTWLYCTATNNGVRVGTNDDKTFTIDAKSGYLKHTTTGRYLGVYRDKPDWRCYTSTTTNIANQTLGFYKKSGGVETTITYNSLPNCETPIVETPTFTPENGKVDGENKFTEPFSLTIASATDDAIIHYSIDGVNFNTYTAPITISSTTTIQAYATADGYDDSNTAEVTYTFIETHTVIWYDGESTTEEKYTDGATLNLPITTPTSSHDEYNNFVGWTASPSGYSGIINPEEPTYVSAATIVKADMNLYAVFNNASLSTTLVTDATNLAVGDKIIIAAKGYDYALSTTQNNNNREQASITKDGNTITFGEDVQVLTIEAGTKDNTFAFNTGSGYLYAASSGSNYLRTQTTKDDNGSWNITITDNVATIKAQGTNTRNWLRYNSTNKIFSCYGSGQQDVSIYKISGTLPTGWTINTTTTNDDVVVRANKTLIIYQTTTANTLTIKSNLDVAGQVAVTSGSLTAQKVVVEKTIDASRWFFFSLPFNCNVAGIVATGANGTLTYAPNETDGDYVIAKYNNGWVELIGKSHTLNANQGYIIGHFGSGDVTVKFPSNGAQNISAPTNATLEKTSDNDFNLIGLPYFQKVTNAGLNVEYVSIPNTSNPNEYGTYTQEEYAKIIASIAPFTSFFVQTEDENIEFTLGAQQNAAPRLDGRSNRASLHKAVVTLTDANGGADKTTIINNPSKTTDYEIGHDLTKLIGYAEIPQIYSLQGDEMLAFNSLAIDNSTVIPLGVYAHADGDYTFALSEKSVGDLEGWELYDNETGKTTRLANEDLTVNLAQGTHEGRFEIRLQQRISTDCDNAMGDMTTWTANGTLNINNLPADAVVYIYDAVGRMVYVANNNSTTFNYTFAARGVYNIVVRTAENSVSFKTIY